MQRRYVKATTCMRTKSGKVTEKSDKTTARKCKSSLFAFHFNNENGNLQWNLHVVVIRLLKSGSN